jgi:stringent starvation protein B
MTDAAPPPRMTSHRPYLLRALYEWILDNGMTPYVLVDARRPGVRVPPFAVQDGRVTLNIAPRAVVGLEIADDAITFTARFSGVSYPIRVPVGAVLVIHARETGQGMALPEEPYPEDEAQDDLDEAALEAGVEADDGAEPGPGDDGDDTPPPRRGGHLRVVK